MLKSSYPYLILFFLFASVSLSAQTEGNSIDIDKVFLKKDFNDLELKEWKRLRHFQEQLKTSTVAQGQKNIELKNYAKDSLNILKVKLLAIKILDSKNLLEHDIAENTNYYLTLLKKLKESDLKRSEYLFLENKLAFLTTEVVENKFAVSKIIIAALAFLVVVLFYFVFKSKPTKKGNHVHLSPQEINVQRLILGGRTNKEIANELFISLSTVKTHITNIYSKLRVSNRQELLHRIQN